MTIDLEPQEGPQRRFLESTEDVVIYGGSAGGGKSWALMADPLYHIDNKAFNFLLFRRTYPEITKPGALWDASHQMYGQMRAKSNKSELTWTFPSGAVGGFAHMQHNTDRFDYKSSELPWIGFDQLEMFDSEMFTYMLSRNRSTSGVKARMRASCNPDASSFVYDWVVWYLDKDGFPDPQRAGQTRYFAMDDDEMRWADSPAILIDNIPNAEPKSFTFIPAKLTDNKVLMDADTGYMANLKNLPKIEREQLLEGRWVAMSEDVVFPEFDRECESAIVKNVTQPRIYNGLVGVDPGFYPDPTGALWGWYDFEHDLLVIRKEYFEAGKNTKDLAGDFKRMEREVFAVDGKSKPHTVRRWSDVEKRLIADLNIIYGYNIYQSVKAGAGQEKDVIINRLRVRLQERRILIHPDCRHLLRQLRLCKKNTTGNSWIRTQAEGHFDLIDALLFMERNIDKSNPFPKVYEENVKYPRGYFDEEDTMSEMDKVGVRF